MGATEFGRWHCWQLRCRIGAMSFEKVTDSFVCAPAAAGIAATIAAARHHCSPLIAVLLGSECLTLLHEGKEFMLLLAQPSGRQRVGPRDPERTVEIHNQRGADVVDARHHGGWRQRPGAATSAANCRRRPSQTIRPPSVWLRRPGYDDSDIPNPGRPTRWVQR